MLVCSIGLSGWFYLVSCSKWRVLAASSAALRPAVSASALAASWRASSTSRAACIQANKLVKMLGGLFLADMGLEDMPPCVAALAANE